MGKSLSKQKLRQIQSPCQSSSHSHTVTATATTRVTVTSGSSGAIPPWATVAKWQPNCRTRQLRFAYAKVFSLIMTTRADWCLSLWPFLSLPLPLPFLLPFFFFFFLLLFYCFSCCSCCWLRSYRCCLPGGQSVSSPCTAFWHEQNSIKLLRWRHLLAIKRTLDLNICIYVYVYLYVCRTGLYVYIHKYNHIFVARQSKNWENWIVE